MISVIVPAYNIESCIARSLDSILVQTYSDIEIIVVNDGSQDGTGAVIDGYSKQYPERIIALHIPNGGVTNARLTGIARAKGEWIGFVDGDDVIEPDMYERLLRNAETYDAQISHCGYRMCFPDGRVNYFHNTGLLTKYDKISGLKELLSGSRIEPGLCNKLFHKTLLYGLLHSEAMDVSIKINEDLLMNFFLFSAADASVFDDWCPYHYIVRSASASRAKINYHKIYDPIQVKAIIRKNAEKELYSDAQRAYLNTCINTYHALMFEGDEYRNDLSRVRYLLKQEKKSFSLLGKKRSLMACLIIIAPIVYKPIYGIYCRYFQKNLYS